MIARDSRHDESDRAAIAVIHRLVFLAGFHGAMRAIESQSLSVFGRFLWRDHCQLWLSVFGGISRRDCFIVGANSRRDGSDREV